MASEAKILRSFSQKEAGASLMERKRLELPGRMGIKRRRPMLWTIFVILLILWLLGLVSGYTIGGFIHVLLVIAIVVVLIRIIQGRRPL
jgi:Flp pilus assembly protein TadB